MTVLFWDIDGTLITTGRAGMIAWNDAVLEVTGHDFDLKTALRTAGFTDHQIAVRTFEFLGLPVEEAQVRRLVTRYEEMLPAALPQRQGRVLDNVREILDHLSRTRPDVRSLLLTGNTRGGARAKLTYYDLMHFFPDGAFCEDTGERAGIARRALTLAQRTGAVDTGAVFVIGDTPHDIECARAIDARTIAVATGGYTIDELIAHQPWQSCETLPPPEAFVRLIDAARDAGGAAPAGLRGPAAG